MIQKIKILDSEKIEDGYERVLRAQFADGKNWTHHFKQLLTAYQEQKKRIRMKRKIEPKWTNH